MAIHHHAGNTLGEIRARIAEAKRAKRLRTTHPDATPDAPALDSKARRLFGHVRLAGQKLAHVTAEPAARALHWTADKLDGKGGKA